MDKKIAITGMGIVSAIGMSVEENLQSLLGSRHGISTIENRDTRLKNSILVGEIKKTDQALMDLLQLPKSNNFSRTALLGLLAIKEAIDDAGLSPKNDGALGFINSTTVGGMDIIEKYYHDFLTNDENRHYIEVHDAGSNTEIIAEKIGLKGFVTTISTACSSAANAIMLGSRMIESGRLDRVIVGGMDALSKFTMNGFNSLMILSDTYNQPFDQNRKGLNLGEGAAYLVLESEESRLKRNKKPLAYLAGFANANDAFHQTASSDEGIGAYLAMEKALGNSKFSPGEIDYINVHGTATPNNDLTEGRAMNRLFKKNVPKFSSTKPFTGHTLAAAGAVEAVFGILALQKGIVFPNLNYKTKMEEFDLVPNTDLKKTNLSVVMSNSFGFGGNCSSLIFCKHEDR